MTRKTLAIKCLLFALFMFSMPAAHAAASCFYDQNNFAQLLGAYPGPGPTFFIHNGQSVAFTTDPTVELGGYQYSRGALKETIAGGEWVGGLNYYNYELCIEPVAPKTCSFNGTTIPNGGSFQAYLSSSVPYGSSCTSETRTCTNGSLSGSYTATDCKVVHGKVSTQTETSTESCPSTHPAGQITMTRTYEVWSDGTKKNYSSWTEASRSCEPVMVRTETENRAQSCPQGTTGTWQQSRTVEVWSDGSKRNYSEWADTTKTCTVIKLRTETETSTEGCPSTHPTGQITMTRSYDLWSDGSKRDYSAWTEASRSCEAAVLRTETETQTLACPPGKPSGTWVQTRSYDVMTDGSVANHSAWADSSVCINKPPVVENVTLSLDEDTQGTLTLAATDDENAPVTFSVVVNSSTAHGVGRISGNTLTFTPAKDWSGTTSLTYRARDASGALSNIGTVTITVRPVNDPPTATRASIKANEGQASSPVRPVVEDVDLPYGDTHTIQIISQPEKGTAEVVNGQLVYTPAEGFVGSDAFSIRATDSAGVSVDGQATVVVEKFNYPPSDIVVRDVAMYAGIGGTASLEVISLNKWDTHRIEVVTQPARGQASISGNTLTVNTESTNDLRIKLRATDEEGLSVEKDLTIKLAPAWDMIKGRQVVDIGYNLSLPAIAASLQGSDGYHPLQVKERSALAHLGRDLVLVVKPDASSGASVENRRLRPGDGMRLVPHTLTDNVIAARISPVLAGYAGNTELYLSRADMTGPAYRVPVEFWVFDAELESSHGWTVQVGLDKSTVSLTPKSQSCVVTTNAETARAANPVDNAHCAVRWKKTPSESQDASSPTELKLNVIARDQGTHAVTAVAVVYDNNGQEHQVGTFTQSLNALPSHGKLNLSLTPALEEAYLTIQDLSITVRHGTPKLACDLTGNPDHAKNQAKGWSQDPACLVEWVSVPPGMTPGDSWATPQIQGNITALGQHQIVWRTSIFTPSGEKVVLGEQQHTINVVEPPPIEITLPNMPTKLSDTMYSVPTSGGFVGIADVAGIPASIRVATSRGFDKIREETFRASNGNTRATAQIIAPEAPLWTITPFTITANYALLPTMTTQVEAQLVAVPGRSVVPVILNEERKLFDTDQLVLSAQIQDARNPNDWFSVPKHGDWDIRFVRAVSAAGYEAVTDWQAVDEEGKVHTPVSLDALSNQVVRIFAEARVRSPIMEYTSVRKSPSPLALSILNAQPISAEITTLRHMGEAPFRTTLYVGAVQEWERRDIGNVLWEISSDGGASWSEHTSVAAKPVQFSHTFDKGHYLVRATLENRHSGAKSVTPTVEVIAFNVPEASLNGPQNIFVGSAGTFTLTAPDGEPLNPAGIKIQWSEDRGTTWVDGGVSYSLTSDIRERLSLQARLRYEDAPDHPLAYHEAVTSTSFRAIRPPRVQITGPRRPDVGVESVWQANVMPPYPGMDLDIDGFFILPDGSQVQGREARYTPTQTDLDRDMSFIAFDGWIKGYEDKGGRGVTQRRLSFWSYSWPEWRISARTSAIYAPADVTVSLRNLGAFRDFDNLLVDWVLPESDDLTVSEETSHLSRSFSASQPGEYVVGVHVSDEFGNYTYAETQLLFYQPPPWEISLSWSSNNDANRAPLAVLVRPRYVGGHPRDRILTKEYSVNGQLFSSSGDYGRVTLNEGSHTVNMRIKTEMGHEATGSTIIEVIPNIPPVCKLTVTEGNSSWLAKAECTDEDGRMASHNWWINGAQQAVTSSSISIPKWRHPNGEPIITVVGIDDSGMESPPVAQK